LPAPIMPISTIDRLVSFTFQYLINTKLQRVGVSQKRPTMWPCLN
jgi:hypothetical protein